MSRGSKKGCCHAKRYHCCHLQFNVSWDILWASDTRTLSQVWNRKWKEKHKVLKVDILTGCNKTSKIGTTAPGVVSKPESYLEGFGTEPLRDSSFACARSYLVRVNSLKPNCEKFDNLRYEMSITKEKTLNELPPTSSTIHGQLLWSHYFVYLSSNILVSCSETLKPAKYEWIIENELLFPTKNFALPSDHTTKCRCKKRCVKNCWCRKAFDARNIATV